MVFFRFKDSTMALKGLGCFSVYTDELRKATPEPDLLNMRKAEKPQIETISE